MTLVEKIAAELEGLPAAQQAEVLDFVELLASKRPTPTSEADCEWSAASVAAALRGMEDEPEPYSLADLKERFS